MAISDRRYQQIMEMQNVHSAIVCVQHCPNIDHDKWDCRLRFLPEFILLHLINDFNDETTLAAIPTLEFLKFKTPDLNMISKYSVRIKTRKFIVR